MKLKVGDKVKVVGSDLFNGCEGVIVEVELHRFTKSYLLKFYKGNNSITEWETDEYLVYFQSCDLELI